MAGKATTSSTMLSLLAGAGLLLASVRAACYDTWGNLDSNQLPCFGPETTDTTATTWCCNRDDYCLSNGLCLSPDSNNLMMQQGCTDENWGEGCQRFCAAPSQQGPDTNSIPLIACPASFNRTTNDIKFCCGPDASSCCETPSSWISIPTGSIIRDSVTTPIFSSNRPSQPDGNSSSGDPTDTLKLALGIGLGIGLPVLLALLAVVYLLIRPLSRRHLRHRHHSSRDSSGSHAIDDGGDDEKLDLSRCHQRDHHRRRDSFGRVNTNIGPPSDDGHWDPMSAAAVAAGSAWPPDGAGNVAAAIAAWARAGAGTGGLSNHDLAMAASYGPGMEPPPSPKEMDGRCRSQSQSRGGFRDREMTAKVAELPVDGADAARVRVRVREVAAVNGAEEAELPGYSPDSDVDADRGGVRREKM